MTYKDKGKVALGYSKDFSYNKDWKKEKLFCGYEHCIELMPLVPHTTRKEAIEHNGYLKRCLKTGKLADGSPVDKERKKFFKKMIEEFNPFQYPIRVDKCTLRLSCPVFGHNCPGGIEKRKNCKARFPNVCEDGTHRKKRG